MLLSRGQPTLAFPNDIAMGDPERCNIRRIDVFGRGLICDINIEAKENVFGRICELFV